jgi:hypothetical protein
MKREAFNHSKVLRLARQLGVPVWGARGICSSVWILTEVEAPRGDIGKLANEDIALRIGWDQDPEKLINALIVAKLLDEDEIARVIVHDWSEHAPDYLHARLARAGELFADGKSPNLSRLTRDERAAVTKRLASAVKRRTALYGAGTVLKSAVERNTKARQDKTDQGKTDQGKAAGQPQQQIAGPERVKLETEGLRLVRQIAEVTGADPPEIVARASTGFGRFPGGRKTRLDTMPDERLQLTVIDLREEWRRVAPKVEAGNADEVEGFFKRDGRTPRQLADALVKHLGERAGEDRRVVRDGWFDELHVPQAVRIMVIQAQYYVENPAKPRAG